MSSKKLSSCQLPIFAKGFERAICNSLFNYFLHNKLFTPSQLGCLPRDSCIAQLLSIIHEIQFAFDENPAVDVRGIFLNISKAFDKVWHDGLFFKLKTYGVEGGLLLLLKNYLKNCKQRIVLNGQISKWRKINFGVPQGWVLRPLLFLVYINDLPDGITSTCKIFAGDTSLFAKVQDIKRFANELNCDLEKVSNWACQWKMHLTPIVTNKQMKLFSIEKLTQTVFPIHLLNSMRIILLNVLLKNI